MTFRSCLSLTPFKHPPSGARQIGDSPFNQSIWVQISHFTHLNDTAPESDLSFVLNLILAIASKYDCRPRLGSGHGTSASSH